MTQEEINDEIADLYMKINDAIYGHPISSSMNALVMNFAVGLLLHARGDKEIAKQRAADVEKAVKEQVDRFSQATIDALVGSKH